MTILPHHSLRICAYECVCVHLVTHAYANWYSNIHVHRHIKRYSGQYAIDLQSKMIKSKTRHQIHESKCFAGTHRSPRNEPSFERGYRRRSPGTTWERCHKDSLWVGSHLQKGRKHRRSCSLGRGKKTRERQRYTDGNGRGGKISIRFSIGADQ